MPSTGDHQQSSLASLFLLVRLCHGRAEDVTEDPPSDGCAWASCWSLEAAAFSGAAAAVADAAEGTGASAHAAAVLDMSDTGGAARAAHDDDGAAPSAIGSANQACREICDADGRCGPGRAEDVALLEQAALLEDGVLPSLPNLHLTEAKSPRAWALAATVSVSNAVRPCAMCF